MSKLLITSLLDEAEDHLRQSADATEEGNHIEAMRRTRSAIFGTMEALRELTDHEV